MIPHSTSLARPGFLNRAAHLVLALSAVIALISVFGFKFFTLNPEFLARFDWAMRLYPYSYTAFAQAQIFTGWLATALMLISRMQMSWLKVFLAIYGISLASEYSGTSWGLPFGHYEYTNLLGYKIGNKVPWLIPMSWFFMGLASYRLGMSLLGSAAILTRPFAVMSRCLLATAILLLWDVTLDPAMSQTTPFWLWEQPGSYYGMPAMNILGWAVTGFAIMLVFEFGWGPARIKQWPQQFASSLYATNLILPLGLLAAVGAWVPLFLTLGMGLILWLLGRWLGRWSLPRNSWSRVLRESAPRSAS